MDGPNIYAYVGNNPWNAVDPTGRCANRDSGRECVVVNDAGKAGEAQAAHLQQQVRAVDRAIQALAPDARLKVDVGNGQYREMTGQEIQQQWAETTWTVVPEGTCCDNTYGAEMNESTAAFRTTPSYYRSFLSMAGKAGRGPDTAARSVILHDFGHSTPIGPIIMQNFNSFLDEEAGVGRLGRALGDLIGVLFECQTFNTGC